MEDAINLEELSQMKLKFDVSFSPSSPRHAISFHVSTSPRHKPCNTTCLSGGVVYGSSVSTEKRKGLELRRHDAASQRVLPPSSFFSSACSQAADADGSEGIEMDEFIEHFGDLLGASLSEVILRHLLQSIA